jgi:outer membrane protein TolC
MLKTSPRRLMAVAAAILLAGIARAQTPLGLERVLADVDAANPSLAAKRHETDAARARAQRAGAWDAPMLELSAENVPVHGGFDADPMTMRVVGLEQRLDVFRARSISRTARYSEARAVGAGADAARWERFADAWGAFADAYFASTRAAAAEEHQQVMNRMAAAARARYGSGRGRLDGLLRVEAERARIVADAVGFAAEARSAHARLDALRGLDARAEVDELAAPPETQAADSAAGWRDAVAAHPRLRSLAERERGQLDLARAARRMAWPELSLRAAYGFRGTLADGTAQDDMWSAGVGVMLPIGTGARQGAEAAEAAAMAAASEAERRDATLELQSELVSLRAQAAASRRTIALLTDTVLVAQKRSLAASWSAYEAGAADLADVLDAAHASYSVELEASRAHQELAGTLARLLAVTARPDLVGVRVPPSGADRRKP